MDLINSFADNFVYECIYQAFGRKYEFACDEVLKELDVCLYKGDLVVVVKVKSKSEVIFKGELAKLSKVKACNQLV